MTRPEPMNAYGQVSDKDYNNALQSAVDILREINPTPQQVADFAADLVNEFKILETKT